MDQVDHYKILGIDSGASLGDIKAAYKKLVVKYHPDKNVNKNNVEKKELEEKFKLLKPAYDILCDSEKRKAYDCLLATSKPTPVPPSNPKPSTKTDARTARSTSSNTYSEYTYNTSKPFESNRTNTYQYYENSTDDKNRLKKDIFQFKALTQIDLFLMELPLSLRKYALSYIDYVSLIHGLKGENELGQIIYYIRQTENPIEIISKIANQTRSYTITSEIIQSILNKKQYFELLPQLTSEAFCEITKHLYILSYKRFFLDEDLLTYFCQTVLTANKLDILETIIALEHEHSVPIESLLLAKFPIEYIFKHYETNRSNLLAVINSKKLASFVSIFGIKPILDICKDNEEKESFLLLGINQHVSKEIIFNSLFNMKVSLHFLKRLIQLQCPLNILRQVASDQQLIQAGLTWGNFASSNVLLNLRSFEHEELKKLNCPVSAFVDQLFTQQEIKDTQLFSNKDMKLASDLQNRSNEDKALNLQSANWNAKELKTIGFNAYTLINIGFSIFDLKTAGFTLYHLIDSEVDIVELKNEKFDIKEIVRIYVLLNSDKNIKSEYCASYLKKNEFGVSDLLSLGYELAELREAGFTVADLKKLRLTPKELKETGYSAEQLKKENYTLGQLKLAGFPIKVLKNLNYEPSEFREAGFTVKELKEANFTLSQLKPAGYPILELLNSFYEQGKFRDAGFTAEEIREVYFIVYQCKHEDLSIQVIKNLNKPSEFRYAGYTAQELKEIDFTLAELKSAGFTAQELKEADFTLDELKLAGFTIQDLGNLNYKPSEFREAGFTAKELKDAHFTLFQLKEAGYDLRTILKLKFNTVDIHNAFKLDEIKATVDFEFLSNSGYTSAEIANLGCTQVRPSNNRSALFSQQVEIEESEEASYSCCNVM